MCSSDLLEFPEITSWIRADEKDFKLVKDMHIKETGILVSCSDYHIYKKMKLDRQGALDKYLAIVKSALDNGTDIPPMCPRNREALDYFIQNGGLFAISTGRALPAFMDYAKDVPMSAPCVIANGAAIYDFRANEYLYTAFLGEAIYDHMAEVLARFPTLAFEVYHDDCRIHAMNPNR